MLSALMQDPGALTSVRFSMCPECQKKYKAADFGKMRQDLMDYLKKAGAKIAPVEKSK